jgi:homoserine O-acetyltransferase
MRHAFAPKPTSAVHFGLGIALAAALFSTTAAIASASDGEQQFANLGSCELDSGQQIENCQLGYRTWGTLNAEGTNAVLFLTYFTGDSADLAGLVGKGQDVDPAKYFVIAVDALGDGVSSSSSNSTTQPRLQFPAFTIRDMVHTQYRLMTEILRLKHIHAVMGVSMGGMQTFEWMVDYPEFMDLAIPIVGSTRLTSHDLLLWHAEEDAVRADPAWHAGNYAKTPPLPQVAILHAMNLTTPSAYNASVKREDFPAAYAAYSTLGVSDFDANNRIYQLEAMIQHDIAHGASLEDAAKLVHAKVFVIASRQDHMVNPVPAIEFARLIGAKLLILNSDCGHLAPGCEADKVNPALAAFLDGK